MVQRSPHSSPTRAPSPPGAPAAPALLLAAAALLLASVAPAPAQVVTGQVVAEDTGQPLAGAMVVLVDTPSRDVEQTLTDREGRFWLQAPGPGSYSLRVDRIGHGSTRSDPFQVDPGATVRRRIEAPLEPLSLAGISVEAQRTCTLEPAEGAELARVWDEARKALERTAFTRRQNLLEYEVETWERTLDPMARRVEDETTRTRSFVGENPFESASAASLLELGFVQESGSETFYYAPDAEAILSNEFRSTHCFRLTEREGDGGRRLGIGFEPVEGRGVPEIEGVMWLDPESSRLESLEFSYVNLSREIDTRRLGGYVEFRGLPWGAWMVPRWWIRMPIVGVRDETGFFNEPRRELAGIREVGGEVVETSRGLELAGGGPRGSAVGSVYDSTRARPLAGATVRLEGTGHRVETDGLGQFRLNDLRPGTYLAAFRHPRLDTLGVELPGKEVTVEADRRARIRLAVPSWGAMLALGCEESERKEASSAVVVGFVRDRLTGAPVAGASVRASRPAGAAPEAPAPDTAGTRHTSATSDARGVFRLCRVPAGEPLAVVAEYLGRSSEAAEVRAPAGEPVFRELELPLSEPIRVVGTVRGAATGAPLPEAIVRVDTVSRTSDDRGRFVVDDLAPGLYPVEVRHMAYGTLRDTVLLRGQGSVHLDMALRSAGPPGADVVEIEGIEVTVRSEREERIRRMGTRFDGMLPAQVDSVRDRVTNMEDLLEAAGIPGFRITERQILGNAGVPMRVLCLEGARTGARATPGGGTGGCAMPEVYVDGVRIHQPGQFLLDMDPSVVWSFEFVPPIQARMLFGPGAEFGALVVETLGGR